MEEKFLYLAIDIFTLSFPFVASFYPKHAFYKEWKYLFPSLFLMASFFVVWKVIFGFSEEIMEMLIQLDAHLPIPGNTTLQQKSGPTWHKKLTLQSIRQALKLSLYAGWEMMVYPGCD